MPEYSYAHRYHDDSDETKEAEEKGSDDAAPDKTPKIKVRHTEARSGSLFSIILYSLILAALLGSVVYSYDRRNTIYNKASDLNAELGLVEAENVRLQSELDSKMSAKNVEEYVENELGMQKIDSSQIKYIKIQTDDVVNIPQQDEGLIGKIKDFFDRCVEYFRG